MSDKFEVHQYIDENGDRYGKSETCPNKCYYAQGELIKLCAFYNIMQVGNQMKEWCSDNEEC